MPIPATALGLETEPVVHEVDARWTMAYGASLDDTEACYLDTTREGGVVAHPLFPICPEWPVVLEARDLLMQDGLTPPESRRGVHASHDLHVHRLVRPGDRLHTRATIVSIEPRAAGAYLVLRLETVDELGEPVATTFQGSLYRDVEVTGEPGAPLGNIPTLPAKNARVFPTGTPDTIRALPIAANAAHTYTECARIWNPIHTDREVALAAGLPDIILHGSATLALTVSKIVSFETDSEPEAVRRICGSFRGMVLMPSELELRIYHGRERNGFRDVFFEVINMDGRAAIGDGLVVLG